MTPTGSIFSVRLDARTQGELERLVEHFTARDELGRPVTSSQITRSAIHDLHQRTFRPAAPDDRTRELAPARRRLPKTGSR